MCPLRGFLVRAHAVCGCGGCRNSGLLARKRERCSLRFGRGSRGGRSGKHPVRRFAFTGEGERLRFRLCPDAGRRFRALLLGDTLLRTLDRSRLRFSALVRALRGLFLGTQAACRSPGRLRISLFTPARLLGGKLLGLRPLARRSFLFPLRLRTTFRSLGKRGLRRLALLRQRRRFPLHTRIPFRRGAGFELSGFARLRLLVQLPLDFQARRMSLGRGLFRAHAVCGSGGCRSFKLLTLTRERFSFRVGRGSRSGCSAQHPFRRFAFTACQERTRFRLCPHFRRLFRALLFRSSLLRALPCLRLGVHFQLRFRL